MPLLAPANAVTGPLRNVYYNGIEDGDTGRLTNSERVADRCTVKLSYRSVSGDRYSDDFFLDAAVIYRGTWVESSKHPGRTRERGVKQAERIAAALERHVAEEAPRQRNLLERVQDRRAQSRTRKARAVLVAQLGIGAREGPDRER